MTPLFGYFRVRRFTSVHLCLLWPTLPSSASTSLQSERSSAPSALPVRHVSLLSSQRLLIRVLLQYDVTRRGLGVDHAEWAWPVGVKGGSAVAIGEHPVRGAVILTVAGRAFGSTYSRRRAMSTARWQDGLLLPERSGVFRLWRKRLGVLWQVARGVVMAEGEGDRVAFFCGRSECRPNLLSTSWLGVVCKKNPKHCYYHDVRGARYE